MKHFFKNPKPETLVRLRQGPLRHYLRLFARELSDQHFSISAGCRQIMFIADFSQWLKVNGIRSREITSEHPAKFREYLLCTQRRLPVKDGAATLRRFLDLLRREAVIPKEMVPPMSLAERLTHEYLLYLRQERGLASGTIQSRRSYVIRFLAGFLTSGRVDLSGLCSADVVTFVQRQAAKASPNGAMLLTSTLRSFLHYARYQGYIQNDLAAAVPAVANWSMQSIPRSLPRNQVERVISSCNRQTAIGRRDYAMLLLLARLGLRAGEVASLLLDDIDWQGGSICVHGKSGHRPHLPLPPDVGEALAEYLRDGRPHLDSRAVFLSGNAPMRAIRSSVVTDVVKRTIERAGIDSRRKGAHQFRHSLATEMLRQGASLGEIGELLGHRSPDTTAIYAKVDLASLRKLAMPWPGGAI
jgi:integrase/recombinase XerD